MSNIQETQSTKDKIVDAALKMFSEKGYLGATTKELAREAGIAEVTLFRHFPSKEQLFEEVLNTNSFHSTMKIMIPEIKEMPYEEALFVIAAKFIETLTLRKDMVIIMHSEMRRYPEKIHNIYHSFIDESIKIVSSYFQALQKEGTLRDFSPEFGARAFMGMFFSFFNMQELMMRKVYRDIDNDAAIRTFVSIFVRGTLK